MGGGFDCIDWGGGGRLLWATDYLHPAGLGGVRAARSAGVAPCPTPLPPADAGLTCGTGTAHTPPCPAPSTSGGDGIPTRRKTLATLWLNDSRMCRGPGNKVWQDNRVNVGLFFYTFLKDVCDGAGSDMGC